MKYYYNFVLEGGVYMKVFISLIILTSIIFLSACYAENHDENSYPTTYIYNEEDGMSATHDESLSFDSEIESVSEENAGARAEEWTHPWNEEWGFDVYSVGTGENFRFVGPASGLDYLISTLNENADIKEIVQLIYNYRHGYTLSGINGTFIGEGIPNGAVDKARSDLWQGFRKYNLEAFLEAVYLTDEFGAFAINTYPHRIAKIRMVDPMLYEEILDWFNNIAKANLSDGAIDVLNFLVDETEFMYSLLSENLARRTLDEIEDEIVEWWLDTHDWGSSWQISSVISNHLGTIESAFLYGHPDNSVTTMFYDMMYGLFFCPIATLASIDEEARENAIYHMTNRVLTLRNNGYEIYEFYYFIITDIRRAVDPISLEILERIRDILVL